MPYAQVLHIVFLSAASTVVVALRSNRQEYGDHATVEGSDASPYRDTRFHQHYHYMPTENAVICGCAKCGSTSLYGMVYQAVFGHPWNFTGPPFIQDVTSERWQGKFKLLTWQQTKRAMQKEGGFSFALVRDPKQRLVSAWKSKIACDGPYGTDLRDRARIVPKLLSLVRWNQSSCLSFEDFVRALHVAHTEGRGHELNTHFRSQRYGCFKGFAPRWWTKVASISQPGAAAELSAHLGANPAQSNFPRLHASPAAANGEVVISPETMTLLDAITGPEYSMTTRKGRRIF